MSAQNILPTSDIIVNSDAVDVYLPAFTATDAIIILFGDRDITNRFLRATREIFPIKEIFWRLNSFGYIDAYRTQINGKPVVLVETASPTSLSPEYFLELATCLAILYIRNLRIAGILYTQDFRYMDVAIYLSKKVFKNLEILSGESVLSNVVLVTYGVEKESLMEPKILEAMNEEGYRRIPGPSLSRLQIKKENIEHFSGSCEDVQRILGSVIKKEYMPTLRIQQELVDLRLPLSKTHTGKALIEWDSKHTEFPQYTVKDYFKEHQNELSAVLNRERMEHQKLVKQSQINYAAQQMRDDLEIRISFPPIRSLLRFFPESGLKMLRPQLQPGYRRLEWRCTCGELLYGDFKETTPGAIEKLAARLREHSGRRRGGQSFTSQSSTTSGGENSRSRISLVGWNVQQNSGNIDPNNQGAQAGTGTGTDSSSNPAHQQTLQLCIETGKYTLELSELASDHTYSDGELFEKIREKYENTRHSIFPIGLRFRKPERAIFIKFRLRRRPFVSLIAGSIDSPSIPPEEQVTAGNYKYDPCPMEELPIDNRTFFHHFYTPASYHPDNMWGSRLPWRLGPGLGPMADGWGIHLEEQPDRPLFAAFMFLFLIVSGLFAGIYSWRTGDHSRGVAIGAWLTAVQTMGMAALFFWWV